MEDKAFSECQLCLQDWGRGSEYIQGICENCAKNILDRLKHLERQVSVLMSERGSQNE